MLLQVSELSIHVQELLAFCGFNFLRLKSFYLQGGARLVDELSEALEDKFQLVPPGKHSGFLTKDRFDTVIRCFAVPGFVINQRYFHYKYCFKKRFRMLYDWF